jgi:hypothetical protein
MIEITHVFNDRYPLIAIGFWGYYRSTFPNPKTGRFGKDRVLAAAFLEPLGR